MKNGHLRMAVFFWLFGKKFPFWVEKKTQCFGQHLSEVNYYREGILMKHWALILTLVLGGAAIAVLSEKNDVAPYRKISKEKHDMRIINSGMASLYARVDMIRRAEKTIDLESYIFNTDNAGKIILKELAAAAKRGVKVRILVDKFFGVFKLNEYYAQELKKHNIDIRYYNASSIFQFSTFQSRNHRKLMVRDGKEAITGGRNIADEYFDLSKEFNFLDRDATVEGEIVQTMNESFNRFWDSPLTQIPPDEVEPPAKSNFMNEGGADDFHYEHLVRVHNESIKEAAEALEPDEEHDKILDFAMSEGKKMFQENGKYECPEVAFASDKEGAGFFERLKPKKYDKNYRHLRREIMNWMEEKARPEEEMIFDTPYFLPNKISDKIAKFLEQRRSKVSVMTNSLASTDAIPVATVFSDTIRRFTSFRNFKAYVFKGHAPEETKMLSEDVKNSTWGTHSKSVVFNNDSFMVGSFNMDNRSSFYNTELSIFCSGSEALTNDVKNNIKSRMDNSHGLNSEGEIEDECEDLNPNGLGPVKKALYWLLKIPSHLMQSLL